MLVIAHPTGNQNFRNATEAFYKNNQLAKSFTAISWKTDGVLSRILPKGLLGELNKRNYLAIPSQIIETYPYYELGRLISKKLGFNGLIRHNSGMFSVDKVYRTFDKYVAAQLPSIGTITKVYSYEDGALQTFKAAKSLGLETVYELPIGYWRAARQILGEEAALKPEWANTIVAIRDGMEKLERKDAELALADRIIVPSRFVADTLASFDGGLERKIHVVPYGSPKVIDAVNYSNTGKLKVLFVGGLSQRKGLSYLFDAIKLLGDKVELTVIGHKVTEHCEALNRELNRHRYIPGLPHREVLKEMAEHDVLVFPSLFEGFALVILEAMAQGVPVIATANAGPGDTIVDGKNGYLVPIRNSEVVAEKLELLIRDRDLLNSLKNGARQTAINLSWNNYQSRLVDAVEL